MKHHGAIRSAQQRLAAPLHPILVHFTIALTTASLIADVLGRVLSSQSLSDTGWWTLVGAVGATVFTLATGVVSRLHLPIGEGEARSFLRLHMALGPTFFGLLLIATIWRASAWERGFGVSWWYLVFLAGTALVMTAQGYLGGEMVYRFGTNVCGGFRGLNEERQDSSPPWPPGRPRKI